MLIWLQDQHQEATVAAAVSAMAEDAASSELATLKTSAGCIIAAGGAGVPFIGSGDSVADECQRSATVSQRSTDAAEAALALEKKRVAARNAKASVEQAQVAHAVEAERAARLGQVLSAVAQVSATPGAPASSTLTVR